MFEKSNPVGIRRGLRVAASTAVGAGLLFTAFPSVALAAPGDNAPANDNIRRAQNLSSPAPQNPKQFTVTGNNDFAGAEPGETSHYPAAGATHPTRGGLHPASHSVWFKWLAPSGCKDKKATIDTEGSDADTTLAVYTVADRNHPRVNQVNWPTSYDNAQGDDVDYPDNLTSEVTYKVTQPRLYFIAVDGYNDDETGDFNLNVQCG